MSETAISLVTENKAKWQYLNEGSHNIAVLFVLSDRNIDEKHLKGLEIIENKVFRITKYFRVNPIFKSAKEQLEYDNMFSKYGIFNIAYI